MTRSINRIAVLGSGLMGSSLALHIAGCGFEVVLLDLKTQDGPANQIADQSLKRATEAKPSNLYHKSFLKRIRTGNFEDDMKLVADCQWVLEAVVERLDVKQSIYAQLEPHRKPGTLVSSNTSGIPIHLLAEGRSDDFKRHFCGTHFFNPPRYLALLEIIPTDHTAQEVTDFFMYFGKYFLGKETVLARDTPAFIANRVGVVALSKIFELCQSLDISIDDADKLTGPTLGRPKTGTFRLIDLVGLDTAATVVEGLKRNCPDDQMLQNLTQPEFIKHLLENKAFGNKSGKGFYLKSEEKDSQGKNKILSLNLKTLQYEAPQKKEYESLKISKQIDDLPRRINAVLKCTDPGAQLIRLSLGFLFAYASRRIPEISTQLHAVDGAMRNGFGWELGPFEYWDIVGLQTGLQLISDCNESPAAWVNEMALQGKMSFYTLQNNRRWCYNPSTKDYEEIAGQRDIILLSNYTNQAPVYSNDEAVLHDIGDGVLCLEFRSKHNAIGEGILRGIQESVRIAEDQRWKGLVIGNNAAHFTVGANLMLVGMMAFQQEFDQLDLAVQLFQQTSMRCRYSAIPVVCATQGYCFGGGVELLMHCDACVAAVESYIGLVEVGVGILPGGGGTKEFALRLSDQMKEGEVIMPQLIEKFRTIATAQVATSAYEAFDFDYLQRSRDEVSVHNKLHIQRAKAKALSLADSYVMPTPRNDIMVLGRSGLATLYTAAHTLYRGNYATEHDIKIAKKIAYVMCGGDLSYPQQVTEQYLLDLEREAFLSLCSEPKTMERIQHMLEHNKPLRN